MASRKKDAGPKVGLRATSGHRVLAFGLVRVGMGMAPLMETEKRLSGKMLDPVNHLPVKQAWKDSTGEEIDRADTVKGYPHGDGFVILADGEVPKATDVDEIALKANVPASEIPSEYVEKSYLLWPDQGQDEGYAVVLGYMRDNNRAFIGTTTDAGTTKAFAVKYSDVTKTLVAELLNYEQNVRWTSVEQVTEYMESVPEPSDEMMSMASSVFDGLDGDFDWASVTDTYGEALADAVAQKAAGGAVSVQVASAPSAGTPDLMAALKATVDAGKVAA